MDQTPNSLSVIALFEHADIVVKTVLLLLLFGSVWSWAVVVDKWVRLRGARRSARAWMDRATGAAGAEELIGERFGADSGQPAGAVIAAGIEECTTVTGEGAETLAERRDRIERAMRLALSAAIAAARISPAVSRDARLGRAVHRAVRHGLGHHAQLQRDRRSQQHQPRRRRAGHRRRAFRHRDGSRRGDPGCGLLQQVHGRDRPLRRGDAGPDRPQRRVA